MIMVRLPLWRNAFGYLPSGAEEIEQFADTRRRVAERGDQEKARLWSLEITGKDRAGILKIAAAATTAAIDRLDPAGGAMVPPVPTTTT